ncbi:MAG: hypothetical protein WC586_03505 [Methanoregula sp.]
MIHCDGCTDDRPRKNIITLALYGWTDPELANVLRYSLERFTGTLQGLPVIPAVSCQYLPVPEKIPAINQERVFLSSLEQVGGNITIGVTGTGFFDPTLGRHLFSYGMSGGRGVLSTYRFQKESNSRSRFLDRMGKQVVKTLALACTLGSCPDPYCIVSYHRWAEDLDRNRYICGSCREEFSKNLAFFLDLPGREGAGR